MGTDISMFSNSSRLRCLDRKAAARFLTSLASRLLRPDTSGGIKSLVVTRSDVGRGFLGIAEWCGGGEGRLSGVSGSGDDSEDKEGDMSKSW
jgi:hypothetical protein